MRMENYIKFIKDIKRIRGTILLKKYRINTTVSQKHWGILKKQAAEKYKTQQKTLEAALESLEADSKQSTKLSPEEELWMRVGRELKGELVLFQKNSCKLFFDTIDRGRFEKYIADEKPIEFVFEYYYRKPVQECTMQEIVEGVVINTKMSSTPETLNYSDDGDHYTVNFSHALGINFSWLEVKMYESLFKTCGIRAESQYSERKVWFKIYKK